MDERLKKMVWLAARSWRFWIVVAALLGLPVLYVTTSSSRDVTMVPKGTRPTEFRDLWEDPLDWDDGKSVVPRAVGPTSSQRELIDNFDRAWIAAIEYNFQGFEGQNKRWHNSDILGFREITGPEIKNDLRRALNDFNTQGRIGSDVGVPEAWYEDIGMRLQYGDQFVDVSFGRDHRAWRVAWFYDKESMVVMPFPKVTTLPTVLARLRKGLPRAWYFE
jgi:hypothetical protein